MLQMWYSKYHERSNKPLPSDRGPFHKSKTLQRAYEGLERVHPDTGRELMRSR